MSGPFKIGSVNVLRVDPSGFSGWDYPSFATTHRRLDDGTGGSVANEIVQSPLSVPARRAIVSGNFIDRTDLTTVRGYSKTKEQVTFTDDNGEGIVCVVLEFSAVQVWPGYWTFDMELLEMP